MRTALLPLLLGVSARAADPTCTQGLKNGTVCCASECGECGGPGCGARPGGSAECCSSAIEAAGQSCETHDAPCVLASSCALVEGRVLGTDHIQKVSQDSVGACCAACEANPGCKAFTYATDSSTCYVKDNAADQGAAENRVSGTPSRPPPPPATCTVQSGVQYIGHAVAAAFNTSSAQECCNACGADARCKFWTYDSAAGSCGFKDTDAPDDSRQNPGCTSGFVGTSPPAPPAPHSVDVAVGGRRSETGPNFVCWNIDASRNREFFDRNLSAAGEPGKQLAYQAAALSAAQVAGYSLLRFGGSGNDYLTYEVGGTPCPPRTDLTECMNMTQWRSLLSFTEAASARMIFGLSMNTGHDMKLGAGGPGFPFPWDPANARAIMEWTIAAGLDHLIFAFELGNEQNNKYSGAQTAQDFEVLWNVTKELWPDASKRPVLMGPDPHSYHGSTSASWIADFLDACKQRGVPVWGATHHEYTEVDSSSFTSPSRLDLNGVIAHDVNKTVREHNPTARVFGGEIGPHNGGSPPCDHSSMRWANFGDSLWYADALASKARNGYAGFCRQDYVGADYGLVDCSTGTPLPDYYTALLWARTMGLVVLDAAVATANATAVRAYAHCARGGGGAVAALVINLGESPAAVSFGALGAVGTEYVLSPSGDPSSSIIPQTGLLGTGAALNGRVLRLAPGGALPDLTGRPGSGAAATVPATSIGFFILPAAAHPDC